MLTIKGLADFQKGPSNFKLEGPKNPLFKFPLQTLFCVDGMQVDDNYLYLDLVRSPLGKFNICVNPSSAEFFCSVKAEF